MDLATFNRYRRTGITKTTQALEDLYRTRPQDVVDALDPNTPFEGLPEPFLGALRQRGLSDEEINHIRDWPTREKNTVRDTIIDALRNDRTVHFRWKLHELPRENTDVRADGPDAVTITFFSPWDNLRALARDQIDVVANP